MTLRYGLAVLREAVATAWSQRVASIITVMIVAGMCASVVLTTGRTVGAEQAVLSSIDSAGTRSIVVRADPDAGIDTDILLRLSSVRGIEWAGAFGQAVDVRNALLPGATKVPLRSMWTNDPHYIGLDDLTTEITSRTAWGSDIAIEQLGLRDGVGGIVTNDGVDYAVAGSVAVPDYLNFMEPLLISPQDLTAGDVRKVAVLVIVADRPDQVAALSATITSLLAATDSSKVKISTSANLADLRALVQGQLGTFGRGLVIVIFALSALLVAAILYGLVMLRRKDYGRRRALGATRALIVALLLTQVSILSLLGAGLGSAGALVALAATGDPLPDVGFVLATGILAVCVGLVAAVIPALSAARRDPLRELRVP